MGATIAEVNSMIAMSLNQSLSPIFMSQLKSAERNALDGAARRTMEISLAQSGLLMVATISCVGLALSAGARELLLLIATNEFRESHQVVAILCGATVLRSSYFVFSQPIFFNHQAVKRMPLITGTCAAINIGANLVLLPRIGFIGAALASLLSEFAMTSLALIVVRPKQHR